MKKQYPLQISNRNASPTCAMWMKKAYILSSPNMANRLRKFSPWCMKRQIQIHWKARCLCKRTFCLRLTWVDINVEICLKSTQLPGDFHKDPADRFITATCLLNDATLITRDKRLHEYPYLETHWQNRWAPRPVHLTRCTKESKSTPQKYFSQTGLYLPGIQLLLSSLVSHNWIIPLIRIYYYYREIDPVLHKLSNSTISTLHDQDIICIEDLFGLDESQILDLYGIGKKRAEVIATGNWCGRSKQHEMKQNFKPDFERPAIHVYTGNGFTRMGDWISARSIWEGFQNFRWRRSETVCPP